MPDLPKAIGTEIWLALVIVLLAALWSVLTPWFLTLPNMVDILET